MVNECAAALVLYARQWLDAASADDDGDSDGADFLAWQQQLGCGPAVPVAGTVPEPATFSLLLAGLAAIARRRKRRGY